MFDKMVKAGHAVHAVKTADWFPLASPSDLVAAEEFVCWRSIGENKVI